MIYFIIYHAVKYRVFESSELVVMRLLWYSLYIPLMFIRTPTHDFREKTQDGKYFLDGGRGRAA